MGERRETFGYGVITEDSSNKVTLIESLAGRVDQGPLTYRIVKDEMS